MATREELDFINVRWGQLNALSKESAERAINFLMLTNAGGAVATLSFLGAVQTIRSQWAPQLALFFFILGIILVGVHTAVWVHHVEHMYKHWRIDSTRFLANQLSWDVLNADDDTRSERQVWLLYTLGYLSFACFVLGAFIGLVFTHF
jgi:hypothetical protein